MSLGKQAWLPCHCYPQPVLQLHSGQAAGHLHCQKGVTHCKHSEAADLQGLSEQLDCLSNPRHCPP